MAKGSAILAASLVACGLQALSAGVVPCDNDVEFKRAGTLVPRSKPDPKDDQWMIGCEVLDRDFARFSAYKDYLPGLGIRSIRLQGGWAKCEKVKGVYDFAWLDEPVDFALAHGSRTARRDLPPGTAGWTHSRATSRAACATGRCGTSPTSAGTSR